MKNMYYLYLNVIVINFNIYFLMKIINMLILIFVDFYLINHFHIMLRLNDILLCLIVIMRVFYSFAIFITIIMLNYLILNGYRIEVLKLIFIFIIPVKMNYNNFVNFVVFVF